jgi:hypothetical protein
VATRRAREYRIRVTIRQINDEIEDVISRREEGKSARLHLGQLRDRVGDARWLLRDADTAKVTEAYRRSLRDAIRRGSNVAAGRRQLEDAPVDPGALVQRDTSTGATATAMSPGEAAARSAEGQTRNWERMLEMAQQETGSESWWAPRSRSVLAWPALWVAVLATGGMVTYLYMRK